MRGRNYNPYTYERETVIWRMKFNKNILTSNNDFFRIYIPPMIEVIGVEEECILYASQQEVEAGPTETEEGNIGESEFSKQSGFHFFNRFEDFEEDTEIEE